MGNAGAQSAVIRPRSADTGYDSLSQNRSQGTFGYKFPSIPRNGSILHEKGTVPDGNGPFLADLLHDAVVGPGGQEVDQPIDHGKNQEGSRRAEAEHGEKVQHQLEVKGHMDGRHQQRGKEHHQNL